jgi:putative hydrolase of the HAD superfamily
VRRKKPLLVVDLDDTLVDTSHVYWTARSGFVEALAKRGVDSVAAIEFFEEQDASNMRAMGFDPERYTKTMLDVYRRLVDSGELGADQALADECRSHGRIVIDQLPALIGGARELLTWAHDHFRVIKESLQKRKIAHSSIGEYFDEINIVSTKGPEQFAQLISAHDARPNDTWVIGDSIRSDVNPAIHVGANAILYAYSHHSYYWRQEYGVVPEGCFHKVDDLADAVQILRDPTSWPRITPEQWSKSMADLAHPGAA